MASNAANGMCERSIRFDVFELDARNCQLRRNGAPVALPPQALCILLLLAARPNELVTRKEIKETLWPDESYGDFDSRINFAVKTLREALGDSAGQPRYVLTERKVGYRFIAPVRTAKGISSETAGDSLGIGDSSGNEAPASPPGAPSGAVTLAGFQLGRGAFLVALIAVASVAAIGSFVLRSRGNGPSISTADHPSSTDDSKPEISSVTPILPQARQRIVIEGHGFGLHVPYAQTDSPYLAIRDDTAHWAAGRVVPHNWDEVMLDVESWTDDRIVISGFSGDYGKKGWRLLEGDELEIAVWNPQNGIGPARYRVSVVSPQTTR